MKLSCLSFACALALAASSAAAVDVALVPSPTNLGQYTGQFEVAFTDAGERVSTWQFVSPVQGTLAFDLTAAGSVQFEGYQIDGGPIGWFGGAPNSFYGGTHPVVTGIPISSGQHELLVGYRAAPQLPPRAPATGGFTGTLTIEAVSAIPEPHTWMLLAAGLLMTAGASVAGRRYPPHRAAGKLS